MNLKIITLISSLFCVIKTAFPIDADVNDFRKIIDGSFVPVVVLGGAAMGDDIALLKMVKMSMDSGA